jgi:hypothetical protein
MPIAADAPPGDAVGAAAEAGITADVPAPVVVGAGDAAVEAAAGGGRLSSQPAVNARSPRAMVEARCMATAIPRERDERDLLGVASTECNLLDVPSARW